MLVFCALTIGLRSNRQLLTLGMGAGEEGFGLCSRLVSRAQEEWKARSHKICRVGYLSFTICRRKRTVGHAVAWLVLSLDVCLEVLVPA